MQRKSMIFGVLVIALASCSDSTGNTSETSTSTGDGDGDGDASGQESSSAEGTGDGDGGDGDGDGDPDTGDGDGDPDTGPGDGDGDGDGDPDAGDGDGDPDTGPGDGDGDGDACASQDQSCAKGEVCCEGLTCCEGVPVPRGQEYCGAQCPDSDRNLKFGFQSVDTQQVLDKVAELPISTWSYKSGKDDFARHIGPMAQDFQAAFDVGASDRSIFQIDADGVSLAAIQALDAKVDELEAENARLRATLRELEDRLTKLEK